MGGRARTLSGVHTGAPEPTTRGADHVRTDTWDGEWHPPASDQRSITHPRGHLGHSEVRGVRSRRVDAVRDRPDGDHLLVGNAAGPRSRQVEADDGTSSLSGFSTRACFPRIASATWATGAPLETVRNRSARLAWTKRGPGRARPVIGCPAHSGRSRARSWRATGSYSGWSTLTQQCRRRVRRTGRAPLPTASLGGSGCPSVPHRPEPDLWATMAGLDPIGRCPTRSRGIELSNPKFTDIRDPRSKNRCAPVTWPRAVATGPIRNSLLDGIRPTGNHDLDTAFQLVLVGVQTHQSHRHDLIKVRGLAKKMGEERLVPSSEQE